jgi:hypothetical protein
MYQGIDVFFAMITEWLVEPNPTSCLQQDVIVDESIICSIDCIDKTMG